MSRRANDKTELLKNKKMNDETYALRIKVMEVIYTLKKSIDLPRITVRITETPNDSILGAARINHDIIWITERCINMSKAMLFHVIAHEVGHAVYGLRHNEKCKLMCAVVNKPSTTKESLTVLKREDSKRRKNRESSAIDKLQDLFGTIAQI